MQKKPIHPDSDESDSWADDQKDRGYYYDDAHGYEEFDPEEKEEDQEAIEKDAESERRGDAENT